MNTAFFEKIIYKYCHKKKKIREDLLSLFQKHYQTEFNELIEKYELKRIKDKYILKINNYDQNSFNKNKIREEELFVLSILLLYNVKNKRINDVQNYYENSYEYLNLDANVYQREFELPKFGQNSEINGYSFRIKMYKECVKYKHFREVYIEEFIKDYENIVYLLIEKFNYELIEKKYLKNSQVYDNGYYFKKIKNEEIIFIEKVSLLREWVLFLEKYDRFNMTIYGSKLSNNTKEKIISYVVENVI